ncbi:glycosyltransferase [Candidatus Microgenomates bacterium]|nr:MAG: glycosyltransferase [Candidatus Microgenomates bacterium]
MKRKYEERPVIAVTIIASNYFPQAEVFAKSYKHFHPKHNIYVLFIDDKAKDSTYFQSVNLKELKNISDLKSMLFKYDVTEFSTAIKPYLLEHLIAKDKPEKIIFFDPDIVLYKPIDFILDKLNKYDIVLIPHITEPYSDTSLPNENDFLQVGMYNLGFVAFCVNDKTREFIKWWENKLKDQCFSAPEKHQFTDQKWMDFAPCYLETYILREPGYDVAYWNLHQYIGKVLPKDITFFHFSGFVPEKKLVSKYQDRYKYEDLKEYQALFDSYQKQVDANQKTIVQYPYSRFKNGVDIHRAIRRIYAYALENHLADPSEDPFVINKQSFYQDLLTPEDQFPRLKIFTWLHEIYPEIQRHFVAGLVGSEEQQRAYVQWCINHSGSEYQIPEVFIKQQQSLLENNLVSERSNKASKVKLPEKLESLVSLFSGFRELDNNAFLHHVYRVSLYRSPEPEGLKKNLTDLTKGKANRLRILYRILSSQEYKAKHNFNPYIEVARYGIGVLALITQPFSNTYSFKNKTPNRSISSDNNKKTGVNVIGYFDTESGVGESARGLVQAIDILDIPVNLNNLEQQWLRRNHGDHSRRFTKKYDNKINLVCVNADQSPTLINSLMPGNFINKYNIGYWYWESTIFPKIYHQSFQSFNEIWVATDFVYQSLAIDSNIPIIRIPPSFVAPKIYTTKIRLLRKELGLKQNDFVFLTVFDQASFIERKNPLAVINAFQQAFPKSRNVKLVIKGTKNTFNVIKDSMKNSDLKNIVIIDEYYSREKLNTLFGLCDAYVQLHRCEGLGIPLIESMLLGKPTIGTNYGGNTDFMTSDNSFLVKSSPYILEKDIGPYPKGTKWVEPDMKDAKEILVMVYTDKYLASEIAKKGKENVIAYFNPGRISGLIERRLHTIAKTI